MFTGLVEQMATIASVEQVSWGIRLSIKSKGWDLPTTLGESICTSGCCLTVVEAKEEDGQTLISFDVIPETLRCTTLGGLVEGDSVNLERSLRADTLLGGHFVQGHIDGMETIVAVSDVSDEERRVRLTIHSVDRDTIVPKGSVTIDGVSLTIATVGQDWFEVALVPTTLEQTTLGGAKVGDSVNIETDILARTVVQVVKNMQSNATT